MKTANLTVRHELILISYVVDRKSATRHGDAPFLLPAYASQYTIR